MFCVWKPLEIHNKDLITYYDLHKQSEIHKSALRKTLNKMSVLRGQMNRRRLLEKIYAVCPEAFDKLLSNESNLFVNWGTSMQCKICTEQIWYSNVFPSLGGCIYTHLYHSEHCQEASINEIFDEHVNSDDSLTADKVQSSETSTEGENELSNHTDTLKENTDEFIDKLLQQDPKLNTLFDENHKYLQVKNNFFECTLCERIISNIENIESSCKKSKVHLKSKRHVEFMNNKIIPDFPTWKIVYDCYSFETISSVLGVMLVIGIWLLIIVYSHLLSVIIYVFTRFSYKKYPVFICVSTHTECRNHIELFQSMNQNTYLQNLVYNYFAQKPVQSILELNLREFMLGGMFNSYLNMCFLYSVIINYLQTKL